MELKIKEKNEAKANKFLLTLETIGVIALVFVIIFVLSLALILVFRQPEMGRMPFFMDEFREISIIVTSLSTILLIYLIYIYLAIYNKIKSQFSLGLIVMAMALMAQSITANPLLSGGFGLVGRGLGPFNLIPSIFTLIATIVLIYLSTK